MGEPLSTQEWLRAMKLIDPAGHDERYLTVMSERYGVTFRAFLNTIQTALQNPAYSGRHRWVWAVLNDTELMAAFDRHTLKTSPY